MKSLYIHIPFCESRCLYCGFYSTTLLTLRDDYIAALVREMPLREAGSDIGTVYLGGGTPSQLTSSQLRTLVYNINKVYHVERDAEITVECNPDDISKEYALELADMGVNRVSLGAQTFSGERLKFIHGDLADKVSGKFDIVVANIVADIIIMFCKTVPEFMADNAVFITSGIIDIREQEVVDAFAENGFEIIARHADGGWRCFESRKKN